MIWRMKIGSNACQIDEIIDAGNAVVFDPDTLEQAHGEGYDNCAYCIAVLPDRN